MVGRGDSRKARAMKALFVDTSGFYAFLDRTDPNHASAVSLFTLAIEKGWELVTTSYVVHESWALIQARLGRSRCLDLRHLAVLSHGVGGCHVTQSGRGAMPPGA